MYLKKKCKINQTFFNFSLNIYKPNNYLFCNSILCKTSNLMVLV